MRKNIVLPVVLLVIVSALLGLTSSTAAEFPSPPSPVVFDAAGNILAATAYPGALPQFRERYVSNRPSAEPWLTFTPSGRAMYNSIYTPGLIGEITAPSPTMASDDNGRTWFDVSPNVAGQGLPVLDATTDTMIATDFQSRRVYKAAYSHSCLTVYWTDDEGASWTPRPLVCDERAVVTDHPTLFVGREIATLATQRPPVYGCWDTFSSIGPQNRIDGYTLDTSCARSDDGGITWIQVGNPFSHPPVCSEPLQGVSGFGLGSKVDHTIFLPAGKCGAPWVAISHDDGNHWDDVVIDQKLGMSPDIIDSDSSQMAEDSAGSLYYVWIAGDGLPRIALSRDRGRTWSAPILVSPPGVTYTKLASITAGANGHMAVTYVGTDVPGGYWASKSDLANAVWHSYATMTLDALDASPVFASAEIDPANDPIKRGPCSVRCQQADGYTGFYDYLRADVNPVTGSVMTSLVDLCIDGCPDSNSSDARAAVGVQVGGTSLFGSQMDDHFVANTGRAA